MPEKDDLPSIDEFGEKLDKARPLSEEERLRAAQAHSQGTALGKGMRVGSELLAALLVAGALGYGLDRLIGTLPWFMLFGIFIGFAAGILNVQRAMNENNSSLEEGGKEE